MQKLGSAIVMNVQVVLLFRARLGCLHYLGRCLETDVALIAWRHCLLNPSWRRFRSWSGLWTRSTGWQTHGLLTADSD